MKPSATVRMPQLRPFAGGCCRITRQCLISTCIRWVPIPDGAGICIVWLFVRMETRSGLFRRPTLLTIRSVGGRVPKVSGPCRLKRWGIFSCVSFLNRFEDYSEDAGPNRLKIFLTSSSISRLSLISRAISFLSCSFSFCHRLISACRVSI